MGLKEEMLDTLQKGKIDTENFNSVSRKTLNQLFEEITSRDVILVYDEASGRVIRVAITITILIIVPTRSCCYLEIRRKYGNGDVVELQKEWTMSETQRMGEEVTLAAVRGLREELGLIVYGDQLRFIAQEFRQYPSTAYAGLWSYTALQRFELLLPDLPWPEEIKEFDDNGTALTIQRFMY